MEHWVYHPYQKPQTVSEDEYAAYIENGWFKSYTEIPGYIPNEHGENINDSEEYLCQFEENDEPAIKKRGRPPRTKKISPEETQGLAQ